MKFIKLNTGFEIPILGLGTYNSQPGEVERAVSCAIDIGYRHFDCAWFYANEAEIGKALKEKINEGKVKREELFITSKLWNNFHAREKVVPKLKETLAALQTDYLDLFLIHCPFAFKEEAPLWPINEGKSAYSDIDYLETWKGMEECVKLGLTKSIGVSNFNAKQLQRVLANCNIPPAVNQVECNPNLSQKKLIEFCNENNIHVTGYSPLGKAETAGTEYPESTIFDPKVAAIGKKYGKTPAQVVLNYLITLGISVVPKSVKESRIKENFDVLDFTLDEEDIKYLDGCNKNKRVCPLAFADHKYYPFHDEY